MDASSKENCLSVSTKLKDERHAGICRCCLTDGKFVSMHQPCDIINDKQDYFGVVQTCFNINFPEDDMDKVGELYLVCDQCSSRLRDCYIFKNQILEALKSFQTDIKVEDVENSHNEGFEGFPLHDEGNMSDDDDKPLSEIPSLYKVRKKKKRKHKKRRLLTKDVPRKHVRVKKQTKAQVDKEILESLDQENLKCKICNEVFHNSFLLKTHVNVHFPIHICEICGKAHATQNRLRNHRRMHMTGNFTCDICGKSFPTKGKFDNHHGKHIIPLRHMCPKCPERFSSYYQRQKHLESAHNEVLKRYSCDLCPRDFTTSGSLFNHKKRNHFKLKTHFCPECQKAFYHKSELNDHMVVHTKERRFLCTVCMKMYPRACTLREHMKIHNNVKNHVCSECGRAFTQRCTLRGHMRVHEKEKKPLIIVVNDE